LTSYSSGSLPLVGTGASYFSMVGSGVKSKKRCLDCDTGSCSYGGCSFEVIGVCKACGECVCIDHSYSDSTYDYCHFCVEANNLNRCGACKRITKESVCCFDEEFKKPCLVSSLVKREARTQETRTQETKRQETKKEEAKTQETSGVLVPKRVIELRAEER
jgi:hypothetical protein